MSSFGAASPLRLKQMPIVLTFFHTNCISTHFREVCLVFNGNLLNMSEPESDPEPAPPTRRIHISWNESCNITEAKTKKDPLTLVSVSAMPKACVCTNKFFEQSLYSALFSELWIFQKYSALITSGWRENVTPRSTKRCYLQDQDWATFVVE